MASAPSLPEYSVQLATFATVEDMRAWARDAIPGYVIVYATAPVLPKNAPPVVELARRWAAEGWVVPKQVRSTERAHCFHYCLEMKRQPDRAIAGAETGTAPASASEARTRDQLRRMLAHLTTLDERGAPCPSHTDMARHLRLGTGERGRQRSAYLLRQLGDAGKVHIARADGNRIILGGRS